MDLSTIATPQFTAALSNIVLAVFTLLLTAALRAGLVYFNTRTTQTQRRLVDDIAHTAVTVTEALAANSTINATANAKKQYALGLVSHELEQVGIRLTPTQIDTAIESAVFEAFNYEKVAAQATTNAATPAAAAS